MMEYEEGQDEDIERYLHQQLEPEELKQFQDKLASDATLRAAVELQAEMKEFLVDSTENELRRNLQQLGAAYKEEPGTGGSKNLWYLLLLIPILGGLLWWLASPSSGQSTGPDAPAVEQSENGVPPNSNTPQQETAPALENADSTASPTTAVPIAANFAPNPALEFLLENNMRSSAQRIEVKTAQQNATLEAEEEMTSLQFTAILQDGEMTADKVFKLHLFDNDAQRFADFEALHSFDLMLQAEDTPNTYQLNLTTEVPLAPGLYYQVLEDFATEQLLWVGKFEVRADDQ